LTIAILAQAKITRTNKVDRSHFCSRHFSCLHFCKDVVFIFGDNVIFILDFAEQKLQEKSKISWSGKFGDNRNKNEISQGNFPCECGIFQILEDRESCWSCNFFKGHDLGITDGPKRSSRTHWKNPKYQQENHWDDCTKKVSHEYHFEKFFAGVQYTAFDFALILSFYMWLYHFNLIKYLIKLKNFTIAIFSIIVRYN